MLRKGHVLCFYSRLITMPHDTQWAAQSLGLDEGSESECFRIGIYYNLRSFTERHFKSNILLLRPLIVLPRPLQLGNVSFFLFLSRFTLR